MYSTHRIWLRVFLRALLVVPWVTFTISHPVAAQDLHWVKAYGGGDDDASNNIVLDDVGNVYLSGGFSGSVVFGEGGNSRVLTSTPGSPYDMFVAKHDRDGELIWVQPLNGTGAVAAGGMDIDASGNILVAGAFSGTATFGATTITAGGSFDSFLVKYDNDGNLIWARTAGGTSIDYTQGVGVDGSGGSCIGGFFMGSMRFGPSDVIDSAGGDDIHLAKYDRDGQILWARNIGGLGRDQGYDVAADVHGNCYVSGEISDTVVVDPGGPNETTLTTSEPGTDVFMAKYDDRGVLQWARSATGSGCAGEREIGRHLAVDDAGDVRVGGYFCGAPTVFGAGEASEMSLSSAGSWDIFAAKYDSGGNLSWARSAGGPGLDQGVDVASDELGNTYVTGRFDDLAGFGVGSGSTVLNVAGVYDIFIAKYDGVGNLVWVRQAGGTLDDHGAGIEVGRLGDTYVTGNFASEFAVFGFGEPGESTVFSNGGYDGFLASFESSALEKIGFLIAEVRRLQASGAIRGGAADGLVRMLVWSRASLEQGADDMAVLLLRVHSFLTRIYAMLGAISPQDGGWLIGATDVIIDQINRGR